MEFLKQIKQFIFTKHFLFNIGFVIIFYLVVVFGSILYLNITTNHGEKISVPNLVGLSHNEAKKKLDELGLKYEILDSIYDPKSPLFKKPAGTVFEQVIEPTSISKVYVKTGRIIGLRLTKKSQLVDMPDLTSKQINFAKSILDSRGLSFNIRYRLTEESNGSVIAQLYREKIISKGTKIPIGSKVTLIVGKIDLGFQIGVPSLVGLYRDAALKILDSLQITSYNVVCADCFTHQDSISALIFYQSPEFIVGNTVFKSTHFTISMSKKPYVKPEIEILPENELLPKK